MNQVDVLPAPVLPEPQKDKWRCEQEEFHRVLHELLRTHRNQYMAVHEGKVVESGFDKLAVAEPAYVQFGYVTIYMSLVTEQPSPVPDPISPSRPLGAARMIRYGYNR